MHRRTVLAGLAAVAAPSALAQQVQTQPARPAPADQAAGTAAGGGVYQPGGAPVGYAGQLGEPDRQWMQETTAAGLAALQTSEIAVQRAQNPRVRAFAGFEAEEQRTLSEVLRSMMEPAATAGVQPPAQQQQAQQPPMQIQPRHAEMVQRLQQLEPGPAFDREYVQGQLRGHQELLQIQERFLQGASNREAMNVAKLARGRIREHIAHLQEMEAQLR
jgi:putative membrane protein